jgi:hypothetical protein
MRGATNTFFFLTFILCNHLSFGQNKWTYTGNHHTFIVTVDTVLCGGTTGDYCPTVTAIHIYNLIDKKLIETILPGQFLFDTFLDSTTVFAVEDMNFDGTTDIRLLNWTSTNLQTTYLYWFYNETTGQFLSDTTLVELINPTFNTKTKTIHTWWRDGFYSYGHAIYEWHDNKIKLIAEEEESWGIDPNSTGIRTIRRSKNGKINIQEIEVKEHKLDYMHKPDECKLHKE